LNWRLTVLDTYNPFSYRVNG